MLEIAKEYAKKNPTDLNKMAAVIAKGRKIIGIGYNSRKTHPLMLKFAEADNELKTCLHAEIDAIRQALRQYDEEELQGASIYIARVLKNGETAMAKPCNVCQKALEAYGICAVYWTDNENMPLEAPNLPTESD